MKSPLHVIRVNNEKGEFSLEADTCYYPPLPIPVTNLTRKCLALIIPSNIQPRYRSVWRNT